MILTGSFMLADVVGGETVGISHATIQLEDAGACK